MALVIRDMKIEDFDVEDFNLDEFDPEEIELDTKKRKKKSRGGKQPDQEPDDEKRSVFSEIMSWVIPFIIAIVVVYLLKTYVIINATIPSGSMENTIMTGDNLIGFRLAYAFSEPERGDIVIFDAPDQPEEKFIKRVIGIPGDTVTIEDATVYVNGEPLEEPYLKETWTVRNDDYVFEVPEGCYLMLGDNRNRSEDARYWDNTYVTRDAILGEALFVYWPFSHFGGLD